MCGLEDGDVCLELEAEVSIEKAKAIEAILEEADRLDTVLTINQLAAELELSRRTIERAVNAGQLIPLCATPTLTPRGNKCVRFSREYVDAIKARVQEARAKGHRIMDFATRKRRDQMTAKQWVRAKLWKMRNLPRQKRPKTTDPATPKSPVVRAPRTPEKMEELAQRRAERKLERIRSDVRANMTPQSVDQALQSLKAMTALARMENSPLIELRLSRLRKLLVEGKVDEGHFRELRDAIAHAKELDDASARLLVLAVVGLATWFERSRPKQSAS